MMVHLTPKSGNAKTGPIPVSTTEKQSCPANCTLKNNGCYAESGPLNIHWTKISEGSRGADWTTFCDTIAKLPLGQTWRHNQAGDLPHMGDNATIDTVKVKMLVSANTGKNGFTYTHFPMDNADNRDIIKYSNDNGFIVNLSAENLDQADSMVSLDIAPVVTIIPEGMEKKFLTPNGNTVITCPATYKDNVSCATCKFCSIKRKTIIAFPVHGISKKKAHKVFMMATK